MIWIGIILLVICFVIFAIFITKAFVSEITNYDRRVVYNCKIIKLSELRRKWKYYSHITSDSFDNVFGNILSDGQNFLKVDINDIKDKTESKYKVLYEIMANSNTDIIYLHNE